VLNPRTKPIRAKARWVRFNLGYPIRQCIEFVLRDAARGERGLCVFLRRSIPGCHAAQQWLSRASHLAIANLTALAGSTPDSLSDSLGKQGSHVRAIFPSAALANVRSGCGRFSICHSSGRSCQCAPERNPHRTPLTKRRLSSAARPGLSLCLGQFLPVDHVSCSESSPGTQGVIALMRWES
jgi:hypothetical protein